MRAASHGPRGTRRLRGLAARAGGERRGGTSGPATARCRGLARPRAADLRAGRRALAQQAPFPVLVEGASGPEPHPSFVAVSRNAPIGVSDREVEGAGQDGRG
jgi:hypothetical protein